MKPIPGCFRMYYAATPFPRFCSTCDFAKPCKESSEPEPTPPPPPGSVPNRAPDCYGQPQSPSQRAENHCVSCQDCRDLVSCRAESGIAPLTSGTRASDEQFGGDHYKKMGIQVWDVVDTWSQAERVTYYRGNALKYIMRLNDKDTPLGNAEKAAHYCRKLVEVLSEDTVTVTFAAGKS